ncbi:transthyretin-like protein [Artemisia annua]|uniref:2-oxo-4-hydroxy-4-carboxy-5-ureidoimidazoline decarboxylase n=1 Tax=Artemisia annua TaxID=35608 RepID=A0A2U1L4A7_ARTAN|nr:transthyretin-like protein [Artemisia annua]
MALGLSYNDFIACCGSKQFAKHMVAEGPFDTYDETLVDVNGWLEAFAAHPQIGQNQPSSHKTSSATSAQWSKGEQSTALATATDSTLQELYEWNSRYREKFGFVFLICASGRTTPEILSELKKLLARTSKFLLSTQVQSTASNVSKAEVRPPITTYTDAARGCPAAG